MREQVPPFFVAVAFVREERAFDIVAVHPERESCEAKARSRLSPGTPFLAVDVTNVVRASNSIVLWLAEDLDILGAEAKQAERAIFRGILDLLEKAREGV